MKDDLYKTLGVDRTADSETIKERFREKAKNAHPDKGGSEEEYKQLAHAYTILKDPEKRSYYDSTGKDTNIELTRQKMAVDAITSMFAKLYSSSKGEPESVDYISKIGVAMNLADDCSREEVKKLREEILTIRKVVKRLKCKKGKTNFIKSYWDQKILDHERDISRNKEDIKINSVARKMLKDFEFKPKNPESYSSEWMPMSNLMRGAVTAS